MKGKLLILAFLATSTINSQSFFITDLNDTILCKDISVSNKFLKYSTIKSKNDLKIDLKKVNGYYLENENTFLQKKEFAVKSGFLGLGKELKDTQAFMELIVEGRVRLYRGKEFGGAATFGQSDLSSSRYWYVEKDTCFNRVFLADSGTPFKPSDRFSFSQLNSECLADFVCDDTITLEELKNIDNPGKLPQILKIVNDYNSRYFKNNLPDLKNVNIDSAKILIFRDFRKELKDIMKISVNGAKYKLVRNSKIELKIPCDYKSEICIENSKNNYCMMVSSSLSFPKYYIMKLNRKGNGYIDKVNGHSSYLKTRFKYYNKNSTVK